MFLEKVEKTILQYNMLQKGDFVVAGLSGGADSVALLEVLCRLQKKYDFNIEAVHIHHGLRGEEANADAEFSKAFCQKRSVPFHLLQYDIAKQAQSEGMGLEEMGRKKRYEAFYAIAGQKGKIAVAHHQNDQAETLLLNLCRGAGLSGLSAMQPVTNRIIRPFLFVSRKEIEAFLKQWGISYCEDSTNQMPEYARNKIRLSVLPFLENSINQKVVEHIAKTASILSEENAFLEEMAQKILQKALIEKKEQKMVLSVPILRQQHSAMTKRILKKAFYDYTHTQQNISYIHLQQMEALLKKQTGKSIALPLQCSAFLEYDNLIIAKQSAQNTKQYQYQLLPEKATYIKEIDKFVKLSFNAYKKAQKPFPICTKAFNYDKIKGNIVCRTRMQGDVLSISQGHKKKLKDFFIDAKIPREQRESLLLFAVGKAVFWIPGYRVADGFLADEATKNKIWISVWEGEHHEREN